MFAPFEVAALVAALGSGLVAGLCFTFGSFVLRALDRLGAPAAVRAMQSINAVILRSSAMAVWFGTLLAGGVALALADDRALVGAATLVYALGAVLVTGRGNVPLNEALDAVDPDAPGAHEAWQRYRVRWARWNALRTALVTASTALFALAV